MNPRDLALYQAMHTAWNFPSVTHGAIDTTRVAEIRRRGPTEPAVNYILTVGRAIGRIWLHWPLLGRTATLNTAAYSALVSSITAA